MGMGETEVRERREVEIRIERERKRKLDVKGRRNWGPWAWGGGTLYSYKSQGLLQMGHLDLPQPAPRGC